MPQAAPVAGHSQRSSFRSLLLRLFFVKCTTTGVTGQMVCLSVQQTRSADVALRHHATDRAMQFDSYMDRLPMPRPNENRESIHRVLAKTDCLGTP